MIDKDTVQSAFTAVNLYQNWNDMSDAQKARGVAGTAIQGYRLSTGEDLMQADIVKPDPVTGTEGFKLGQGMDMFSRGYNAYAVAKNWGQMNNVQKIVGGGKTALDIARTGQSMGLIGSGSQGAAVKGVTEAGIKAAGWTPASNYGIGAIQGAPGAAIPQGYTTIAQGTEGVIAAPTANAASAQGAMPPASAGMPWADIGGAVTVAAGAYQVAKGWGTGGVKGRANGAIGGSMMAAGLYAMGVANPFVLGAVVATSLISNSIKTGKSGDQKARDSILGHFKNNGAVSKDNTMTLADGTLVDLGIDGKGNLHTTKNPDLALPEHKSRTGENKLNYWDIDYTNDLDFWAGMGGITLAQLGAGGKGKPISQFGGKLGNGSIQNIGYGAEFTQDNFDKWRDNMRGMYSQFGVKSKAAAYQLVNQMYADGRIDDTDAASMHQTLDIVYNSNGYDIAQSLNAGRRRGIEVASENAHAPPVTTVTIPGATEAMSDTEAFGGEYVEEKQSNMTRSREEIVQANRLAFQGGEG